MTENISDSTLVELDADKLVALSDQWANSTQKCNKLRKKIDIIRTLEVGIRALVASGYSYDAVCEKLKDELAKLKKELLAIDPEIGKEFENKLPIDLTIPKSESWSLNSPFCIRNKCLTNNRRDFSTTRTC